MGRKGYKEEEKKRGEWAGTLGSRRNLKQREQALELGL